MIDLSREEEAQRKGVGKRTGVVKSGAKNEVKGEAIETVTTEGGEEVVTQGIEEEGEEEVVSIKDEVSRIFSVLLEIRYNFEIKIRLIYIFEVNWNF